MYNFIEYIAAFESKDFNSVEEDKIEWARNFIHSITNNIENEVHLGDCTNEIHPCNLCVLESMLSEYRKYIFENKKHSTMKTLQTI